MRACVLNVYPRCKDSKKRGGSLCNECRKERRSMVRTRHTGKGGRKGGVQGLRVNTAIPSFPDEPWEKNHFSVRLLKSPGDHGYKRSPVSSE